MSDDEHVDATEESESEAEAAVPDDGTTVDYAGQCSDTCPQCSSRCVRGAQHLTDTMQHFDGRHAWHP